MNFKIRPRLLFLSLFTTSFLLANEISLKDKNENWFLDGYSVTVGLSVQEITLNYYKKNDDSDPAGVMTNGMDVTYLFRVFSPFQVSASGKWGYFFETGFSSFNMTLQNIGNNEKDLGTSVKGKYAYITPIAFYLLGPIPKNENKLSIIIGVGIGAGYLKASGNMILTEDGSNNKINIDESGFDLAASLLIEARYNHFGVRIYGGGPTLYYGNNSLSAVEFAVDIGYIYTF